MSLSKIEKRELQWLSSYIKMLKQKTKIMRIRIFCFTEKFHLVLVRYVKADNVEFEVYGLLLRYHINNFDSNYSISTCSAV